MIRFVFCGLVLLALVSCSNDIPVNMQNSGLPVVYCILSPDDSLQQVRLAKSFFPEKGYDSLNQMSIERWTEPVEIYLEEWKDPQQPVIHDFYPSETILQDTGYFANPSFSLYQARLRPEPGVTYYLYLWFPGRNYYAYAATTVVDHPEVLNPEGIPGRKVTFSDLDDFVVQFRPPANSGFHQFGFLLTIEEYLKSGFRQNRFEFGSELYEESSGQIALFQLSSERFYLDLLNRYDTITAPAYRKITGVEFVASSYGNELRLYNQLYNNGTQPWEIQSYSSFVNGFGLFSSKSVSRVTNLELSSLTWQLLTRDYRYQHMKFTR